MKVISTHKFNFIKDEIVKNERTGENEQKILDQFIVSPSIREQTVPDWIRDTEHFALAKKSGWIREIKPDEEE
jgi:hypothetical protein